MVQYENAYMEMRNVSVIDGPSSVTMDRQNKTGTSTCMLVGMHDSKASTQSYGSLRSFK